MADFKDYAYFHDCTFRRLEYSWEESQIKLDIACADFEHQVVLSKVLTCEFARKNEWGDSISVYSIMEVKIATGKMLVLLMQSGDEIRICYQDSEVVSTPRTYPHEK